MPTPDRTPSAASSYEPRLIEVVIEDLERSIALRDAFRKLIESGKATNECDHDWRVDPHVVLPTNPPQRRLMCAKCKRSKGSGIRAHAVPNTDPNTWEKWNG